ncbi:hypothetical protein ABIE67_005785 [Streptomyces sp. V4I8]|uniref:hypothetical protein n=1 Tax=Streptomyces sp. V4I8 TaxID=3156469 RepID=UPI003516DB0E
MREQVPPAVAEFVRLGEGPVGPCLARVHRRAVELRHQCSQGLLAVPQRQIRTADDGDELAGQLPPVGLLQFGEPDQLAGVVVHVLLRGQADQRGPGVERLPLDGVAHRPEAGEHAHDVAAWRGAGFQFVVADGQPVHELLLERVARGEDRVEDLLAVPAPVAAVRLGEPEQFRDEGFDVLGRDEVDDPTDQLGVLGPRVGHQPPTSATSFRNVISVPSASSISSSGSVT